MKGLKVINDIICSELVNIMLQRLNIDSNMFDIQENMQTNTCTSSSRSHDVYWKNLGDCIVKCERSLSCGRSLVNYGE